MQRPPQTEPLGSQLLQEVYGEGYFHGANSGFAEEGYARIHATWQHWMPWVREEVGGGARWLDLGCAYGFLVEEARSAGFRAVGLDASAYAVRQAAVHAAAAVGRLSLGHAEALPFASASVDVVSAFDLLEHVPAPELLVAEVARVLRPGGLFVAATPDPLVFDREEPTHVAEHVPSWWVRTFERAGFGVALRFFQAEYNCELVARRDAAAPTISFDSFAADPVVARPAHPALRVSPRTGIGAVEPDGGRVVEDGAHFHLLNTAEEPLDVTLNVRTREAATLRLSLDGRVVLRSKDATSHEARFLLPVGGHTIRFGVEGGWARLLVVDAGAEAATREDLCLTLPFDLYERYALTAQVLRRVGGETGRVLDVGGTMGGDAGHLAWAGDFFPEHEVTVVDARPADVPDHRVIEGDAGLPFDDASFDVVISQDVLEHVPAPAREAWLTEVYRVTRRFLVLACPFGTPGVAEADRYLFELIRADYGYEHGFLAEHLDHGHPDLAATEAFFRERGASVSTLPSGHLPSWILLQTVNAWLSHPEQDETFVRANAAVNRAVGARSTASPAYRHVLLVDRQGVDHGASLEDLPAPAGPELEVVQAAVAALAADPLGRRGRTPR